MFVYSRKVAFLQFLLLLSANLVYPVGSKLFSANFFRKIAQKALNEQEIEDFNAKNKANEFPARRLIVLPISEDFKANQADPMFGKVHCSDKCSMPSSFARLLMDKKHDFPWIFEIVPVVGGKSNHIHATQQTSRAATAFLKKAYISPLDFRSPENFIFVPKWIMSDLGLRSYDLVDVSFVRLSAADLVVLQPLDAAWDDLIKKHEDVKDLLEHELNKFSSLTAKSTITIQLDGNKYSFFIKETTAENGVSVHGVKIQDSDVRTDIDRSLVDAKTKTT